MATTSRILAKKVTLRHRDLSKEGAWGFAYQDDFFIEIDPNQSQREYLSTLLHEVLHCILPDAKEKTIEKISNILADRIWAAKYRRLSNWRNVPPRKPHVD